VIGIVYGAIVSDRPGRRNATDRLHVDIHFGFIILGIFGLTTQKASRVNALNGQSPASRPRALFLIAGVLVSRRGIE